MYSSVCVFAALHTLPFEMLPPVGPRRESYQNSTRVGETKFHWSNTSRGVPPTKGQVTPPTRRHVITLTRVPA
jgi:hypothetical protein